MFKVARCLPLCTNCFRSTYYTYISQKIEYDETNTPIKYSTSPASRYKAKVTRTGIENERLWYEPPVIIISIGVFLLYFCVFREENDIDKELGRTLYSRIDGLEEVQLKASLQYNLDRGLDTSGIVQRLKEIEREKEIKEARLSEIDDSTLA